MALPFFFEESIGNQTTVSLSENTSRHITQVLRVRAGDNVLITNGKGTIAQCSIFELHKKTAKAEVINIERKEKTFKKISIAISPIKNNARFEWFVEKAAEIGIDEIVLINCDHTEKQNIRYDRLQNILVSAMVQSQQCWLPLLRPIIPFSTLVATTDYTLKLIAHCYHDERTPLSAIQQSDSAIILIGPEGDFSKEEVAFALQNNFKQVTLGETRLRTETAGVAAAVLLKMNAI